MILLLACACSQYLLRTREQAQNTPTAAQWTRFLKAYALIKQYYIKPVSDEVLITKAINGMAEGLDGYSGYLDKNAMNAMEELTSGDFAGIGVQIEPEEDGFKVITPMDNSPAMQAGLRPGDEIIAVDQKPLAGMSLRDALAALRGPLGSKVELTIVRPHVLTPLTITLARAKIHYESVKSRLLAQGFGYVRIALFQADTTRDVVNAVKQLEKDHHGPLSGLIIDVRNNPGGLLTSAASTSNLFLDKNYLKDNDMIVYSKNRDNQMIFKAEADGQDILHGAPIVILINGGSASGAEILAGALHDHHRAKLVGSKTYGKGSVQTVIPLDNDGGLKLTTALYYTPSGHLIDHIGIPPDIAVENSVQLSSDKKNKEDDAVLAKGIKTLEAMRREKTWQQNKM